MIGLALIASSRSTCSRLSVGAVFCDNEYSNIVIGYNGGPKGGHNACIRDMPGSCGCLHAEVNAAIKSHGTLTQAFLTDSPCESCAILMINYGIRRVVYFHEYRDPTGLVLMRNHGVEMQEYEFDRNLHSVMRYCVSSLAAIRTSKEVTVESN